MMNVTLRWSTPVILVVAMVVADACSASTGAYHDGPGYSGRSDISGTGATSGTGSAASTDVPAKTAAGGASGIFTVNPGTTARDGGRARVPDGGCFATSSKAEHVTKTVEVPVTTTVTKVKPFDMFIMYDQSGSMSEQTPVGTKWDAIKAALTAFVQDPMNADVGVGIQYFPASASGCTTGNAGCTCIPFVNICFSQGGGSCNAPDYAKPDVPIAALSTNATPIVMSLGAHGPNGGTPTTPALTGALQYAEPWAAAHPDRPTIVVLATDGEPTGCAPNAVQDVASAAASGLAVNPPVKTFVVGVGSSLTSLNAIAAAGGTDQALIVDAANGDATKQFLDAMNKIRQSVTVTEMHTETHTEIDTNPVPCEWRIPPSPDGKEFDPTKVNVEYALDGTTTERLGAVAAEADCASVADGWYYDDAANPTKVLVCAQTCQKVQQAPNASVQVVFGCKTEIATVR